MEWARKIDLFYVECRIYSIPFHVNQLSVLCIRYNLLASLISDDVNKGYINTKGIGKSCSREELLLFYVYSSIAMSF